MVAIFESKKQVKERVKHVSKFKTPTILSTIAALMMVVILTACGMSVGSDSRALATLEPTPIPDAVPTDGAIDIEGSEPYNTALPSLIPDTTPIHTLIPDVTLTPLPSFTPTPGIITPTPLPSTPTPVPINRPASRLSTYIANLVSDPFSKRGYIPTYVSLEDKNGVHAVHKEYSVPMTKDKTIKLITKETKGTIKSENPVTRITCEQAD